MEVTFTSEIVSIKEYVFEKNLVGIISTIDEESGQCKHAGLIIFYENILSIFHYDSKNVILQEIKQENLIPMLFKKLEIIHELEVPVFLAFCKDLLERGVSPKYGFIFDNSYYDPYSKESFMTNTTNDITTCVGFCIKVIRGFIYSNPEYIKIDDWSSESLNIHARSSLKNYLDSFANESGLDPNELYNKENIKRIKPSELLASTYFGNLPIQKIHIDSIESNVSEMSRKVVHNITT